jgi:hypothetical protein
MNKRKADNAMPLRVVLLSDSSYKSTSGIVTFKSTFGIVIFKSTFGIVTNSRETKSYFYRQIFPRILKDLHFSHTHNNGIGSSKNHAITVKHCFIMMKPKLHSYYPQHLFTSHPKYNVCLWFDQHNQ